MTEIDWSILSVSSQIALLGRKILFRYRNRLVRFIKSSYFHRLTKNNQSIDIFVFKWKEILNIILKFSWLIENIWSNIHMIWLSDHGKIIRHLYYKIIIIENKEEIMIMMMNQISNDIKTNLHQNLPQIMKKKIQSLIIRWNLNDEIIIEISWCW